MLQTVSEAQPLAIDCPLEVEPGATFCCTVEAGSEASPVAGLFGVSFEVGYVPTDVTYVSSIAGSFLGAEPLFVSHFDEGLGVLGVGVSRRSGENGSDGYGPVASVCFKAAEEAFGRSTLFLLEKISALDEVGLAVPLNPGLAEVAVGAGVSLVGRVYLEGAYRGGMMHTELNAAGRLPTAHPYSGAPWAYTGVEAVPERDEFPDNGTPDYFEDRPAIVDYVLLELRSASDPAAGMTLIARKVAFLLEDGSIVGLNPSTEPRFAGVSPGFYYVVVRHRNHLAAMSAGPVDFSSGVGTVDLTDASSNAYGGAAAVADLGDGRYGLIAGDADGDGDVDEADRNHRWAPEVGTSGYLPADFDLNGEVQNTDKNLIWAANEGSVTQVGDL